MPNSNDTQTCNNNQQNIGNTDNLWHPWHLYVGQIQIQNDSNWQSEWKYEIMYIKTCILNNKVLSDEMQTIKMTGRKNIYRLIKLNGWMGKSLECFLHMKDYATRSYIYKAFNGAINIPDIFCCSPQGTRSHRLTKISESVICLLFIPTSPRPL